MRRRINWLYSKYQERQCLSVDEAALLLRSTGLELHGWHIEHRDSEEDARGTRTGDTATEAQITAPSNASVIESDKKSKHVPLALPTSEGYYLRKDITFGGTQAVANAANTSKYIKGLAGILFRKRHHVEIVDHGSNDGGDNTSDHISTPPAKSSYIKVGRQNLERRITLRISTPTVHKLLDPDHSIKPIEYLEKYAINRQSRYSFASMLRMLRNRSEGLNVSTDHSPSSFTAAEDGKDNQPRKIGVTSVPSATASPFFLTASDFSIAQAVEERLLRPRNRDFRQEERERARQEIMQHKEQARRYRRRLAWKQKIMKIFPFPKMLDRALFLNADSEKLWGYGINAGDQPYQQNEAIESPPEGMEDFYDENFHFGDRRLQAEDDQDAASRSHPPVQMQPADTDEIVALGHRDTDSAAQEPPAAVSPSAVSYSSPLSSPRFTAALVLPRERELDASFRHHQHHSTPGAVVAPFAAMLLISLPLVAVLMMSAFDFVSRRNRGGRLEEEFQHCFISV